MCLVVFVTGKQGLHLTFFCKNGTVAKVGVAAQLTAHSLPTGASYNRGIHGKMDSDIGGNIYEVESIQGPGDRKVCTDRY